MKMRLFIAILFDEDIMDALYHSVLRLKSNSRGGSFTLRENLHLTLNFIGETKRVEDVKRAMEVVVERVKAGKFEISILGSGKFKRNEGDIYWVGIEKDNTLWRLQKELVKELKAAGFYDVDDREFKPHLTLGRRVIVDESFQMTEFEEGTTPLHQEVGRISLMKSERVQGKLIYTEIYHTRIDKR